MAGRKTSAAVGHKGNRISPARSAAAAPRPAAPSGAAEPAAIVISHWFDPGEEGEPYSATVKLVGRRSGVSGTPRATDRFECVNELPRVVPGSGPISITSRVFDIQPGEWSVTAELTRSRPATSRRRAGNGGPPELLPSASWSWLSWSLVPGSFTSLVKTKWQPLARLAPGPGMMPGAVPALVAVGAVLAVVLQARLAFEYGLPVPQTMLVTLIASILGLLGAKAWYATLHPRESLLATGWAVDGFLVAAPIAAIVSLVALGLPVGPYLDATAPGLFLAVAIGRVGCFVTGCCAGRATRSHWALWSSDQIIGARRVPTQLLESAIGLTVGLVTLALASQSAAGGTGIVFGAAFASYLVARHFLLRLRAERRNYLWRRTRPAQPIHV